MDYQFKKFTVPLSSQEYADGWDRIFGKKPAGLLPCSAWNEGGPCGVLAKPTECPHAVGGEDAFSICPEHRCKKCVDA